MIENPIRGLGNETVPGDASRPSDRSLILTVNGGSSSLKFALFKRADPPERRASGRIERIGLSKPRLVLAWIGGTVEEAGVEAPDQQAAAQLLVDWLRSEVGLGAIAAVGHRVVHGGGRYHRPEPVTVELFAELRRIAPYDPEHLPGELELIEAFHRLDPALPQFACFDTAFHHDLPRVATIVPIPRRFESAGVRRYGFHGLSYAFLMGELGRIAGPVEAGGRVILAHLGSGASLAAVHEGRPVETTMGFTPASGLVMGTRSGDIDPGLVRFLMKSEGLSADSLHALLNNKSGLLGVSETSPDLRDLLSRQGEDMRAAEAVELFCYRARIGIGSLAAALGGLETLVFAGGIGENAAEVRRRVCGGLEFLGVVLDGPRNEAGEAVISADGGRVKVRVIRTDEEVMIARAAVGVLESTPARSTTGISRSFES